MKNKLLSAAFMFTSVVAFAQLTVKPTAANVDSYIYVKNEILYVKNEIALSKNNVGDFEASIYLRDGGQLIQDGDDTSNSGTGFLSVRQTDPVNHAYAYRYWASPVGKSEGLGNNNFGVGLLYDHLEPANLTKALKTIPIPTREGRRGDANNPMEISTRWLYTHLYPGTEAEGNYQRINSGYSAPAGFGFTMKGVGESLAGYSQTYEFRGRPNTGEFSIPVGYEDGGGLMTLSGNPYPSALDLNKLFYDPENKRLGTFWYYDEDRTLGSHLYSGKPFGYGIFTVGPEDTGFNPNSNLGIYVAQPFYIWNSAGGSTSSTGTGDQINARRFAPIGQGIMFVGDSLATKKPLIGFPKIKIKNSHRVFIKENNASSIFHRSAGEENTALHSDNEEGRGIYSLISASQLDPRMPQMRLYVVFNDAVTRDLVLSFSNQATDGYDRGLDGHSPMGLKTDAYFPIGTLDNFSPFVIQAVKFEASKKVPINFTLNKQTKIDVRLIEEVKKPYRQAYLFDKQENKYRALSIATNLSSSFYLPAGEHNNRFFITFYDPTLREDAIEYKGLAREAILNNVTFFQNNPARQLEISNPESYNIKSAALYDMNGKRVAKELKPGNESSFSFYTGNLSDGVYLVKLITIENINIDYKTIVQNK